MKLDRNITTPRRGKYALIKLRALSVRTLRRISRNRYELRGHSVHVPKDAIDFGDSPESDFFVIRLKDKYAGPALFAYSLAARADDAEYADEIFRLAEIAACHPSRRVPN